MNASVNLILALVALLRLTTCLQIPHPKFGHHQQHPKLEIPPIQQVMTMKHRQGATTTNKDDLSQYPNITLDYGVHMPTLDDKDAGFVLYKNIRYGQAPINDLRFALPVAPEKVEGDLPVFDGSEGHSCYQALPQWAIDAQVLLDADFNWEIEFGAETDGEDCLFLDVATPLEMVENERYPVLVWIYGGGYVYGKKDSPIYSPAGFYRTATDEKKFLYVALNYRLGAFGFMSGPALISEDGHPNLGLYDQQLAFKWIRDNIAKFGGDPDQVTIMGESAGAGSIAHHLVWNEEGYTPPFKKAILQSPAWVPVPGSPEGVNLQDDTYEKFLDILGANDLDDAREKDVEEVLAASKELVRIAPYGTFSVGPVVDGVTIQAHPLTCLSERAQDLPVEIFTGVVEGEGLIFIPIKTIPETLWEWLWWKDRSDDFLAQYIANALPLVDVPTVAGILANYPKDDPNYSQSKGEYIGISRQTQRLADIVGQSLIQCIVRGISTSFANNTYNYLFGQVDNTYPNSALHIPVLHGGDVPYTFYDPASPADRSRFNIDVAIEHQEYIMGFVLESDPNYFSPAVNMSKYGPASKVVHFNYVDIVSEVEDPYAGVRCDQMWPSFWRAYGEGQLSDESKGVVYGDEKGRKGNGRKTDESEKLSGKKEQVSLADDLELVKQKVFRQELEDLK